MSVEVACVEDAEEVVATSVPAILFIEDINPAFFKDFKLPQPISFKMEDFLKYGNTSQRNFTEIFLNHEFY